MKRQVLIFTSAFHSGLLVNKDGSPFKSGAEFHAERHAEELTRQGWEVTVITRRYKSAMPSYETTAQGYHIQRLSSYFRNFHLSWLLLATYREASIYHIVGEPSYAPIAVLISKIVKIPSFLEVTMEGAIFENKPWNERILHPWRSFGQSLLRRCNRYIAISTRIKSVLVGQGLSPERVVCIHQGIDVHRFVPANWAEKKEIRASLRLTENARIVLFCCRLDYRKGIDLMLDAWEKIRQEDAGAQLLIVGGGKPEWVEATIAAAAASDHSIVYAGEVEDPCSYYQAADIYAFPSRLEGFPTSLMEAMACGCASVVSEIGGNEDLVDEGRGTGLRCPAGDSAALARQIIRLLRDGSKCETISHAARNFVVENTYHANQVKKLVDEYEHLLTYRPT